MADLSNALHWDMAPLGAKREAPEVPAADTASASKDKASREVFMWPTPPYASYPAPSEQTETIPCQILAGADNKTVSARLTFFVPENCVAHVQMPPARTTFPLRFDKFKSLTLTTPLLPLPLPLTDPHADLLSQRQSSPYKVKLVGGGYLAGQTVGHVETEFGLFLFPPCDADGSVRRMFIPTSAFITLGSWSVGAL